MVIENPRNDRFSRHGILSRETRNRRFQPRYAHVEIPDMPECGGQPLEIIGGVRHPLGIDGIAQGAELRPKSPGRHPRLVHMFRIGA